MASLVKDDWEVICHDVLVSCCRSDCDLVESDPVFRVLLAVVFFKLLELKVAGPDDLVKVRGELF